MSSHSLAEVAKGVTFGQETALSKEEAMRSMMRSARTRQRSPSTITST
jgi:hypothetical protein